MVAATVNETRRGGGSAARAKAKKIARALVFTTVIAVAGSLVWRYALSTPAAPPNVISVSGRIEGDEAVVSAKTAGRLREIVVREGDVVKAGQPIAVLDDEQ